MLTNRAFEHRFVTAAADDKSVQVDVQICF